MTRYTLLLVIGMQALTCQLQAKQPIVILPKQFKDNRVIVQDSPAYRAMVSKNKALQKQLAEEDKNWQDYSAKVEQERIDEYNRAQALAAENAKMKAQSSKGKGIWGFILGILNIGVMFLTNPLGYLMQTLTSIVIAVVVIFVVFLLLRFLIHRLKMERK